MTRIETVYLQGKLCVEADSPEGATEKVERLLEEDDDCADLAEYDSSTGDTVIGEPALAELACRECGGPMLINEVGVSNHVVEGTAEIDYDKDADHTAVDDGETLNLSADWRENDTGTILRDEQEQDDSDLS